MGWMLDAHHKEPNQIRTCSALRKQARFLHTLAHPIMHWQILIVCMTFLGLCRLALDHQSWTTALVLAKRLGDAAFAEAATAIAASTAAPGSALHTALLMCGGAASALLPEQASLSNAPTGA